MENLGFIQGSFRVHPQKTRVHLGFNLGVIQGSFRVHRKDHPYTPPPIRGGVGEPAFFHVNLELFGEGES